MLRLARIPVPGSQSEHGCRNNGDRHHGRKNRRKSTLPSVFFHSG
jgi:hypothetical protein